MNTINILRIIIIIIFVSIQIFHIFYDKFLKYPCFSWGRINKTPIITLLWIILIYMSIIVVFRNNLFKPIYIWILFISLHFLIIVSNLDYYYRNSEDDNTNIFSYIHHLLSFITLIYGYILASKIYSKFMNIFILTILILFFILHQIWYMISNKHKKKILKHISTCLELIVFVLILGSGIYPN